MAQNPERRQEQAIEAAEFLSLVIDEAPGSASERIAALTAQAKRKLGRLAATVLVIATGVLASEAHEAKGDTLGYPNYNVPCEHAPYNTAGACADYDWGPVHTQAYNDPSEYSSRGYAYRNCTDYAAWKLISLGVPDSKVRDLGDAGQWYNDAPASERSSNPRAWDAAVEPGSPGHVAFVESVNGDGTITVSEYNHDERGDGDTRTGSPSAMGFSEFVDFGVHPASAEPSAESTPNNTVIAAASHASGEQDIFWRGTDNNLWEGWYQNGAWYGPASLRMGALGSSPAAAVRPATDEEDVFWKGTDGNLWEAYYDGSWHGAIGLGMGVLGSQPAAAAWGNEVDVFWKGLNGNLFEAVQDGKGPWAGPIQIGMGALGSAPTAAAHANGVQTVFWKGLNGDLFEAWYAAGAWYGPADLGMGALNSAPSADVRPSNNEEDVFWQGTDGNIWEAYDDGSWHGPVTIGMGQLGSGPATTASGSEIDVFWRGLTSDLFEAWLPNRQWIGPADLGMGVIPGS